MAEVSIDIYPGKIRREDDRWVVPIYSDLAEEPLGLLDLTEELDESVKELRREMAKLVVTIVVDGKEIKATLKELGY